MVTIEKPATRAAIVRFTCASCSSNTVLKSDSDLLVNTIGPYKGDRLIDAKSGEVTDTLEVTAEGDWTIELLDPGDAPTELAGSGDSVVRVPDGSKAKFTHDGSSNFAVVEYSVDTGLSLLINEIGAYDGTVRIHPDGLFDIVADGSWTITPS